MIISPGVASTALPSTVIVTTSGFVSVTSLIGALPVLDVDEELVAEHPERRDDRRRDRRAEWTDRRHVRRPLRRPLDARADVVAHVHQQVEVVHAAVAGFDAVHDLVEPGRALATGRALAAGLPGEGAHEAPRGPDHAGRVIHGDDRAGAHHRPALALDLGLVEGNVESLGPEPERRGAAGDEGLELTAVADAGAEAR